MKRTPYLFSTIGRKQIMALSGIALCLFVLTHAAGNMFIFSGPEAYNKYSHMIITNPLLYVAEAGLVAIFLGHIVSGVILTLRNFGARQKGYAKLPSGDKAASAASRTMWIQGVVLLGFVVLHLITFKYGPHYTTQVNGESARDLFRLVFEVFQSGFYVAWYVVALLMLCFHLSHGLYSSLQTLGFHHPRFTPKLKCVSIIYGLVVAGAFISQPIYLHFFYIG